MPVIEILPLNNFRHRFEKIEFICPIKKWEIWTCNFEKECFLSYTYIFIFGGGYSYRYFIHNLELVLLIFWLRTMYFTLIRNIFKIWPCVLRGIEKIKFFWSQTFVIFLLLWIIILAALVSTRVYLITSEIISRWQKMEEISVTFSSFKSNRLW